MSEGTPHESETADSIPAGSLVLAPGWQQRVLVLRMRRWSRLHPSFWIGRRRFRYEYRQRVLHMTREQK